jgi:hypothetical protein
MPRCFLCPVIYGTSFSCWFEVFSLFGCIALEVAGKLPVHPIKKKGDVFLTDVRLRFFYHTQAHKEIFFISHVGGGGMMRSDATTSQTRGARGAR